jgi:5-methylcytosine-specific restriction endonuclease McrA
MKIENSKCLILNADYSALGIIGWKKALIWSMQNEADEKPRVEIIDFYKNDFIQGVNNKKYPIPAVVKTSKYFRIHDQRVNFSRKNLFIRDNYSCQYCGIRQELNKLTYDHVIPKSSWKDRSGSPTNWTNIVTACVECNRKKGNRTPKQANMPLHNLPIAPKKSSKYLPITHFLFKIRKELPEEWSAYLPESYL